MSIKVYCKSNRFLMNYIHKNCARHKTQVIFNQILTYKLNFEYNLTKRLKTIYYVFGL